MSQERWLNSKKQELIAAKMSGNESGVSEVTDEVTKIYGPEYARQWRLHILETHAQQRLSQMSNHIFDEELR